MTTYKGAILSATLNTIKESKDIPATLWELLPDTVAGPQWIGEVIDCAMTLADWISDSDEYDLDKLQDLTHQLADSECEDYYSNINKRVQELNLWAITDLDEEVAQVATPTTMLTDLNAIYLYCAMKGLYMVLAQWVIDIAEELESVA